MDARERGAWGEVQAARFLERKGYAIHATNYKCRFGEIDIIAGDGAYIVFVEVKTRAKSTWAAPREWVDLRKQRRVIRAALLYLGEHPAAAQPRFDVVEVAVPAAGSAAEPSVTHIKNAFLVEDLHEIF